MLRKLARWPGSRIALLWIVLVVVQGTCAWYFRVPAESPRGELPAALPELEPVGPPAESDSGPRRPGGIRPIMEIIETVFSPTTIVLLALLVTGMALVLYGPTVAMLVLTALWLFARRKYGGSRA